MVVALILQVQEPSSFRVRSRAVGTDVHVQVVVGSGGPVVEAMVLAVEAMVQEVVVVRNIRKEEDQSQNNSFLHRIIHNTEVPKRAYVLYQALEVTLYLIMLIVR